MCAPFHVVLLFVALQKPQFPPVDSQVEICCQLKCYTLCNCTLHETVHTCHDNLDYNIKKDIRHFKCACSSSYVCTLERQKWKSFGRFLMSSSSFVQVESSPYDSFADVQVKAKIETVLGHIDFARRRDNRQMVVVKTSFMHRLQSLNTLEDPRREVKMLQSLAGSGVVPTVYGEWTERKVPGMPGVHRYAMSYEGSDLYGFITHNDHLSEAAARPIFLQILRSVHYLHTHNIVHLDLKTENILINRNLKVTLCDLGQARELKSAHDLQEGIVGTAYSRAPEITQATRYNGGLADVYSLGVILFVMLLGCPPYINQNAAAFKAIYMHRQVDRVVASYSKNTNIAPLSTTCLDLLAKLMCPPHARMSMDSALRHPWFNSSTSS